MTSVALLAAVLLAAPPADPAGVEQAPGFTLQPGHLDLRLQLDTDILLAYVELGAAVDVGLVQAGPGTLALGGEVDLGVCVTACGAIGLLTNTTVRETFFSPMARVSYHFAKSTELTHNPKLDLYGLAMLGIAASHTTITGNGFRASGSGVGPAIGLGVGATYNVSAPFFIGAEARLRYARGTYTYDNNIFGSSSSGTDNSWSESGLSILIFGGLRF